MSRYENFVVSTTGAAGAVSVNDGLPAPVSTDIEEPKPKLVRVDIGPVWRGEKPPPEAHVLTRSDGVSLFPPGISYIFGDSGDGKSWVMLWAAAQTIRRGRCVVWVTWEDPGGDDVIRRLKMLGVSQADAEELFHLYAPGEGLSDITDLLATECRDTKAALLVLDSIGEVGGLEGVNEDKDAEWGPWARWTIRRLHDTVTEDGGVPDFCVIPIDHTTKSKENPHFPSGTKRKRAFVTGLMVGVSVRAPFGKNTVGRVQLIASKDRTGRFRRGEIAAEITLDAEQEPYSFIVAPPPEGAQLATGKKRTAQERVLEVVSETDKALTADEVARICNSTTNRLPGEAELAEKTVKNALTRLTDVQRTKQPTGVGDGYRIVYAAKDGIDS